MDDMLTPFRRAQLEDAWATRYGSSGGPGIMNTRRPPVINPPPPPTNPPPTRRPELGTPPPGTPRSRLRPTAPFAVRVLAKMGYGHTPQSLAAFQALGQDDRSRLVAYVEQQLNPGTIDDSAVEARLQDAGYSTLGKSLTQLWEGHVAGNPDYSMRILPGNEVQRAAFVRATFSRRQLHELIVEFWHNHFNVLGTTTTVGPVMPHYDRDVIRVNAFGNFRTMLEDVATSTAMLYYLDNVVNRRSGPNENYARELLELHTMGAENYLGFVNPNDIPSDPLDPSYPIGYSDVDVYECAAAFTGWSVRNGRSPFQSENDGTFVYRQVWHDPGPKFVLGQFLMPEAPAMQDGWNVLDRLASHPRVARFVCQKLVRRLVADNPPPALVESAAVIFRAHWQSGDQIARVLRHILLSPEFSNTWGEKQRRPFELGVAALRVTGSIFTLRPDHSLSNSIISDYGTVGHQPFNWAAPNGYPDVASAWNGSNTIAMSWRLLNRLPELNDDGSPVMRLLEISRNQVPVWTATNLVDYWSQRILGYRLAGTRRQLLVGFMAQNGDPRSYVIEDTDTGSNNDLKRHYNQQRLRTMISMLLTSPEFFQR